MTNNSKVVGGKRKVFYLAGDMIPGTTSRCEIFSKGVRGYGRLQLFLQ
jgi:hypothetical protein